MGWFANKGEGFQAEVGEEDRGQPQQFLPDGAPEIISISHFVTPGGEYVSSGALPDSSEAS